MAERSIGMTTGVGDGDVGGYASTRMTDFFYTGMGNGVLQQGVKFIVTGSGTNVITIQDGSALVQGFFYEATSTFTISTLPVANGTYFLVIRVNNTASPVTVVACEGTGATVTTIAPRTVRFAVITLANFNAATDIRIKTIQCTTGNWVSTNDTSMQIAGAETSYEGSSKVAPIVSAHIYYPTITVATLVNTFVGYPNATGVTYSANLYPELIEAKTVGGLPQISINKSGTYSIQWYVKWDANVTGARWAGCFNLNTVAGAALQDANIGFNTFTAASILSPVGGAVCIQRGTANVAVNVDNALYDAFKFVLGFGQNSGTTRTITEAVLRVTRF